MPSDVMKHDVDSIPYEAVLSIDLYISLLRVS